jgi:4-amino-4-deoxy-L-arabinose transferase-like glycosyltransferase
LAHSRGAPSTEQDQQATSNRLPAGLAGREGVIVGAGLIILHLAVQLAARPFPRWGDAILTFGYARDFPDAPADHHSTRFGLILPARLFLEIFGFGQVAYYAYPLLMGILLVVASYSVARRLLGLRAAAVVGFLIVFHPFLVRTTRNTTSWQLLPDVPAAAWFTAGLALLLAGVDGRDSTSGRSSGRVAAHLVGAGLCFGIAYTCREFVAFMFVVIPLVAVMYRLPWPRLLVVAAPMAGILAVELLLAWSVWGDALARFRIAGGHGSPVVPTPRAETLLKFPRVLYDDPRGSVSLLMLVVTVAGALILRRRALLIAVTWFLSLFVPLLLLGGFADPTYISLRLQLTRYWVPVLPALVIGAVAVVRELLMWLEARGTLRGRMRQSWLAAAVAIFLCWYALPMLAYAARSPNDGPWNELRVYLQQHDDRLDRIASDYRSGHELLLYSHEPVGGDRVWHGEVTIFSSLDELGFYHRLARVPRPAELPPHSALLFTRHTARATPAVGDGWVLAFRAEGVRLYVARGSELGSLAGR